MNIIKFTRSLAQRQSSGNRSKEKILLLKHSFTTSHDSVTSQKEAVKSIISHNIFKSFLIQISPMKMLIRFFPNYSLGDE